MKPIRLVMKIKCIVSNSEKIIECMQLSCIYTANYICRTGREQDEGAHAWLARLV